MEADRSRRPRFRLFRTAATNEWRLRDDLDSALRGNLESLAETEPLTTDFELEPPAIDAYRQALGASAPVTREYRGPAFVFPESSLPLGDAVLVTPDHFEVLRHHFTWAIEEWPDIQPVTVVLEDGVAVSICHSPATADGASEAGVFTAESARGRGHAVAVVSHWAQAVREAGRLPLYSTTSGNAASRRVAAKLGLRLYGEDFNVT